MEKEPSFSNTHLDGLLASLGEEKRLQGGDAAACRAYLQSNERGFDRMVVELPPISNEDFSDMLRTFEAAGITEFILADASTGLMESLHILLDAGYEVVKPFSHTVDPYYIIKGLVIHHR